MRFGGRRDFVRALSVALMLYLVLYLIGCAGNQKTPEATAYGLLGTSAETYNAAINSLGDLYKQGIVSSEVKDKAIEYGDAFRAAYNSAISASQAYLRAKSGGEDAEMRDKLTAALIEYSRALGEALDYINPIILKYTGKGGE